MTSGNASPRKLVLMIGTLKGIFLYQTDERRADYPGEQLVMGHSDNNGVLRYGFLVVPQGAGHSLVFREYPASGLPFTSTIAADLPARAWSHVALNMSTIGGSSRLYSALFNGVQVMSRLSSNPIAQCPVAGATPMALEVPGERLFVGTSVNAQYGMYDYVNLGHS